MEEGKCYERAEEDFQITNWYDNQGHCSAPLSTPFSYFKIINLKQIMKTWPQSDTFTDRFKFVLHISMKALKLTNLFNQTKSVKDILIVFH